ncbi:MAG: methyltransferase domain-containing protein, partial [Alphaproteobacteria bacterium]
MAASAREAMSKSDSETWASYYQKTKTRPPCETLMFALDAFDAELGPDDRRFAVDLGCGNGRDAIELLHRGWRILAIDAEQAAIDVLTSRDDLPEDAMIDTLAARFETVELPDCD